MAYAGLGNTEEAFRWLDRAHAERSSIMNSITITTSSCLTRIG
jgi:hypothetical protein